MERNVTDEMFDTVKNLDEQITQLWMVLSKTPTEISLIRAGLFDICGRDWMDGT